MKQTYHSKTKQLHMIESDELLIDRSLKGDQKATETLYTRYIPLARSLQRNISKADIREELWQELWLAFLEALRRYDPSRGPFAKFIKRTLHGARGDFFRNLEKEYAPNRVDWEEEKVGGEEDQYFRRSQEDVEAAVERLPLKGRSKEILGFLVNGMTASVDMAAILQLAPATVRKERQKLRAECQKLDEEGLFLDRIHVS